MSTLKRIARSLLTQPAALRAAEFASRGTGAILTFHRFAAYGRPGHSAAHLARNLELLRRRRYNLASLMTVVDHLRERRPLPSRTVVFTVDDGYSCLADEAAPVFARYDCPVTVFLITGFIDGGLWMWWDRLRYAAEESRRRELDLDTAVGRIQYTWNDLPALRGVVRDLTTRLSRAPTASREQAQATIEAYLDVALPSEPPLGMRPMTWDQVRQLAGTGIAFGPHSVTHPILSQCDPVARAAEIRQSRDRLASQLNGAVPIFCWPNGEAHAFGPPEEQEAEAAGFVAAVSMVQDSVSPAWWPARRFALPRFAYQEEDAAFAQIVSGLEHQKRKVRRRLTRAPANGDHPPDGDPTRWVA